MCFNTLPAHAIMNGQGQDIFPVAAVFNSSATITYTNSANAGLTVSSGVVVSTGNVGIGTAAPESRLHVKDGDIRISTTTGSRGIIFQDGTVQTTAIPVGSVISYAGSTAPNGWLLCDGSAMSRTTYAALFSAIGTTYGTGDGSTTFNLPDIRGRTAVGAGQGSGLTNRALAASGGEETHMLSAAEMPAHNHGVTDPGHTHSVDVGGGNPGSASNNIDTSQSGSTGSSTTGITIQNAGSGTAHNIMQPFLILNYIVKY